MRKLSILPWNFSERNLAARDRHMIQEVASDARIERRPRCSSGMRIRRARWLVQKTPTCVASNRVRMKFRLRLDSGMSQQTNGLSGKEHTCRCDTSSTKTPNGFAQPSAKRCELERHSHLILESTKEHQRKTLPHALRLCTNTRNTVTPPTQSMVLRQRPTRTMCACLWHNQEKHQDGVFPLCKCSRVELRRHVFKQTGTEKLQRLAIFSCAERAEQTIHLVVQRRLACSQLYIHKRPPVLARSPHAAVHHHSLTNENFKPLVV